MERNAFKGLDGDSNGAVSLAEFQARLQELPHGTSGPANPAGVARLENTFKSIDTDGDGQLSATEIRNSMALRERQGDARPAEAGEAGLGGLLVAQLLGQDQTMPGSAAPADFGGGLDAADQARRRLRQYATTQVATAYVT
ncbi:EF-hand domain-containing protein [Siccirubricoccus deserti]